MFRHENCVLRLHDGFRQTGRIFQARKRLFPRGNLTSAKIMPGLT
ncbi:Uncharacterized protein dnm_071530 [Desulfonema magnum]|uniref:Uncharacterized protein n=1 Tax=Desulfonema magnum TaxID=45655 RepID=A0A975BT11_9BACT|nr:Uncharacterized protein dnm_071530 [Desulfonema magnum]